MQPPWMATSIAPEVSQRDASGDVAALAAHPQVTSKQAARSPHVKICPLDIFLFHTYLEFTTSNYFLVAQN